MVTGPHFWIALVSGLILALAFQLLLTNLALALGVTLAGPIERNPEPDDGDQLDRLGRQRRRVPLLEVGGRPGGRAGAEADHLIRQIEAARDDALAKVERFRDEVSSRVEKARRDIRSSAESARKFAAGAAWWAFTAAVVSGIAAIGGALVGVN